MPARSNDATSEQKNSAYIGENVHGNVYITVHETRDDTEIEKRKRREQAIGSILA